jgi:hypothetical protein
MSHDRNTCFNDLSDDGKLVASAFNFYRMSAGLHQAMSQSKPEIQHYR